MSARSFSLHVLVWATCALLMWGGCIKDSSYNVADPARGPGGMVGNEGSITPGLFAGSFDDPPLSRDVEPPADDRLPDCGPECVSFCKGLNLKNPVNRGMCASAWGVGLSTRPLLRTEACRRLFVDTLGFFPTKEQVQNTCGERPFGEVIDDLLARDEFVTINQRRWADTLRYDTEAVSVERVFDADRLVGKLYRGKVPYDLFAAVLSAHPVVTRRHDTAGDRAEAVFSIFMGRPPLGHERSDLARLYALWHNDYYDHPELGMRLPDSFINYRCLTESGQLNESLAGECTSVLYGYHQLILYPDLRAEGANESKRMWAGLLKDTEWTMLQMPGRLLGQQTMFWEKVVDDVLELYLGYDLGRLVPEVRDRLVVYLIEHKGDIRALHHAILSSQAYLQSATGATERSFRWTWGPSKQADAEVWLDSIDRMLGYHVGSCDWRLNRPEQFLELNRISGYALVKHSRWELTDEGDVRDGYRRIARALGGCPSNDVGGRFRVISILTTSTQLDFVNTVCDAAQRGKGVPIEVLLPAGMSAHKAVDAAVAESIVAHQVRMFYGRDPSQTERDDARRFGEQCASQVCSATDFARPACFATLSSAEMLFY